jgi:hypothetical protein
LSVRGYVRFVVLAASLVGGLSTGVSCYRAEVDLAPLVDDDESSGGGAVTVGAGTVGMSGGADGTTGARICDTTPEDDVQHQCRLRPPSTQMCDLEETYSWSGCSDGGCSICIEALRDYPYYLKRHPCCSPDSTCSVHERRRCSPLCPAPTVFDKVPVCFDP